MNHIRNRFARNRFLAALALATAATTAGAAVNEAPQGIIVKYKAAPTIGIERADLHAGLLDAVGRNHGVSLTRVRGIATGAELIRPSARLQRDELDAVIAELARDPAVRYAEEDRVLKPQLVPNDPRFNEQWHYFETTAGINAPAAWDITTGAGVKVGVVDTGFRPHADLAANIVGGFDFITDVGTANDGNGRDTNAQDPGDAGACNQNSTWHGTHVSGTIAALTNNGSGVAGVAFGAKVVPLRVLGECGGTFSDIADGIIWGAGGQVAGISANPNRAKVLNLSLGGDGSCGQTMQDAIDTARVLGTVVVVAAGNSGDNAANHTPANCAGVVTVAAVNRSGGRAIFNSSGAASNTGSVVDLAAPGGSTISSIANGVLSTVDSGAATPAGDGFGFKQGTSMATPHVAGVAALMLSVKSTLTPDQTESLLKSTTRAFPASCTGCGTGIVDALAAVQAAQAATGDQGGSCPSGFTRSFARITGTKGVFFVPSTSGFTTSSQRHLLGLEAGATTLRLSLQRMNSDGSFSTIVTDGTSNPVKRIDQLAAAGTYRWLLTNPDSAQFPLPGLAFTMCRKVQ